MSRKGAKQTNTKKTSKTGVSTNRKEGTNNHPAEVEKNGKVKKNYQLILVSFLLSILVLITFRSSFDNDFVDWDDYTYVVENDLVRNTQEATLKDVFSRPVSLNYHPLTILSLRFNNNQCNTCTEGISATPFIKWNVIIHLLNTLLVFLLIYLLSKKNIFVSFFVAALFVVHPMHVESVVWISERKDVLYSFFFLSGLITYLKYQNVTNNNKSKYFWFSATFLLFILSCLSKAMAVVFPLVLIMINFWLYQPSGNKPVIESIKNAFSVKQLTPLIPFFVVAIFFGLMAFKLQRGENFLGLFDIKNNSSSAINDFGTFSIWQRIQFASYGFIGYIIKFFIPVNLSAIYPYPTLSEYNTGTFGTLLLIAPIGIVIIAGLIIYSLKKTKLFAFGIGFYLITIMMVLQFISVGTVMMADRYTYLSYIGITFIAAVLINKLLFFNKYLISIAIVCYVILLIFLTRQQVKIWENSESLWTRVIELYPHLERPWRGRGKYYAKQSARTKNTLVKKQYEEKALLDFREAIKLGTKQADVFEGAGCIYGSNGDHNNALGYFNKAIELKPDKGSVYFNRGLTLSMLNKNQEAIKDYNLALIYAPQKAVEIITNRSNLFLITGRYKEAIADFDYLISVDSKNFLFYYNRAFAKQQTNDVPGAVIDYLKALQLQPDDQMSKLQLQKLLLVKK